MIRRFPVLVLAGLTLVAVPASLLADDWPGWRGPHRDGRSDATGLVSQWPEDGPPLLFRASGLGSGYSSVSLAGERLFTMGDFEDGQHVLALSRKDGKRLWSTRIGPRWEHKYLGARATPTVDGDRIYALGTDGDLVCLEAATGTQVWRRHLRDDFGGVLMQAMGKTDWRFSESPLIDGDHVVVTPGAADAALVAVDKRTGKTVWQAKIPPLGEAGRDGAGYASPVVASIQGVRQIVQLLGRGVVGLEAATGRFLWGYNRVANDVANISTVLVDGDRVFASSGYGTGAALLHIRRDGDGFRAEEAYFLAADTLQNHHGGMVLHDGYVYTGTGHNKGFPIAVELATGKVAWGPERNNGTGSAALTFADGHLYLRYQNGTMILAQATPEGYMEKGSFEIPEVDQFSWSHPVVVDGKLFLREQDNLFVYDLRPAS